MKKTLLSMLGLMTAGMVSAQVYITDQQFNPNGVNNEGLVVGSQDQNMPFYLWNPQGGTYTKIGGISAGNGVGGNARFSGDGKFVAAPMFSEAIPVITQWIKSEYSDLSEYTYKDIIPMSDKHYFAVGTSVDGKRGAILESVNGGVTWMRSDYVYGAEASGYTPEGGLVSMTDLSPFYFLAGGHNGKLYKTENAYGYELIDIRPEGVTGEVDTYWAMDFINKSIVDKAVNGVVGVEMTDGSYGVWYTADSGETFAVAEGVSGVPAYITSTGDTFFMVTQNGHIQKSADYGKTWTDVFTTDDGSPLYRIRFADESAGVATSDNAVYITENGGADWKKTIIQEEGVNPLADGIKWNDAVWNGDTIVVAGAGGNVYMSTDKGGNFVRQTVDKEYSGDYTTLVCRDRVYNIMAQDGQFYRNHTMSL